MSETQDRVTNAILPAFDHIQDKEYRATIAGCWARAAIEAMRDPPENVLLAPGIPYGGKTDLEAGIEYRRKAWNKMIDAVLAGGQQEGKP